MIPRDGGDPQAWVRADDVLLDVLGRRSLRRAVESVADPLAELLLRWRIEVDSRPLPPWAVG